MVTCVNVGMCSSKDKSYSQFSGQLMVRGSMKEHEMGIERS